MKMERACGSCERGAGLCRLHKEQLQKDAAARPPAMKRRLSISDRLMVLTAAMAPPKGYSVGFTAAIGKGTQKYVCNRGFWTKTGSSSALIGAGGQNLGSYGSVYDAQTGKSTYYWTIINTSGESYESGQTTSSLQDVFHAVLLLLMSTVEKMKHPSQYSLLEKVKRWSEWVTIKPAEGNLDEYDNQLSPPDNNQEFSMTVQEYDAVIPQGENRIPQIYYSPFQLAGVGVRMARY